MEAASAHEAKGEVSGMGLPHLTSFLWCLSLKVGSRLISIMHCMFSSAVVVACLIMAYDAHHYIGTSDDIDHVYTKSFWVTLTIAVISMAHVVLSCTLLYGVFWRKPTALRVWVLVMCVLYAVALVVVATTSAVAGFNATGSDIFLSFLQGLLVFAFIAYCILCVYSYYLMLRSVEEMDHPNKVDY